MKENKPFEELFATKMDRRTFVKAAGVFMASLSFGGILAACTNSVNTGGKPGKNEKVTLELWEFASNRSRWYKNMAKEYKKINPNVTINVKDVPGDVFVAKLQAALKSGSGAPDIAEIEISSMGTFLKGQIGFVELNPYLENKSDYKLDKVYADASLIPWSYQGKYYGIGNELNVCSMPYRFDLFQKSGIREGIETWQEFVDAGKKLVQSTGAKMIAVPTQGWDMWWLLAAPQGGGFFDADGNIIVNNDIGVKTLQFMYDLIHTHKIAEPVKDWFAPQYWGLIDGDKIACQLAAPWYLGFMKAQSKTTSGKWHIQSFPRFEPSNARTATWGGTGTTITKTCKYPDVAWDFIKFANFEKENIISAYKTEKIIPTLKDAWDAPELLEPDPFFDNNKPGEILKTISTEIPALHSSPYWPELTDAMTRLGITPVMNEKKSPKEALDDVANEVAKIMKK